jgi:hypothetical protein
MKMGRRSLGIADKFQSVGDFAAIFLSTLSKKNLENLFVAEEKLREIGHYPG